MESVNDFLKFFFPEGDPYGVVPFFSNGNQEGLPLTVNGFSPIGTVLPWAWIAVAIVTTIILGLIAFYFIRNAKDWGGWNGLKKNFGLWGLLFFSSLLGYVFIYNLIFLPFAYSSIIRKIQVDSIQKKIEIVDQNFLEYSLPFSEISHIAYIRTDDPIHSPGLWLIRDHKYKHAILGWSLDPKNEDEFLQWADDLANSCDTFVVAYHSRASLYSSNIFQKYLSEKGLVERSTKGSYHEETTEWEIRSIPREMDGVDWNEILGATIAILLFSPFYLAFIAILALIPTFLRYFLAKRDLPEQGIFKIIFKSRIFQIGIGLLFAFIISIFNSKTYVKSADTITIQLNETQMYYKIQNQNQKTMDKEKLQGFDFWLDLVFGNPLTFLDRMTEFSKSNAIEQKVYFAEVNKLRTSNRILQFSKREEGKKEDNFETYRFDLSGLDSLVFDYILQRVRKVSGIN